jgi:hypothetical protein
MGENKILCSTRHHRAADITVNGAAKKSIKLMVAVTSPTSEDPIACVKQKMAEGMSVGFDSLRRTHDERWKAFWLRSLMESGDDYLDNLWHVTMYYLNASQRGPYPGRFINGLWGWNRDVQPWNNYFHWNQQMVYWPLNAAGHHDLLQRYLEFRFNALPHAKADARKYFNCEGAFVCDLTERRGFNCLDEHTNRTPVAEIALDFWRQYCYTQNETFLKNRALPYMIEAALFMENHFVRQEDGKYHPTEAAALEGGMMFRDVVTEVVYGTVLFQAVLDALAHIGEQHPHAQKWREIAGNMVSLQTVKADSEIINEEHGQWVIRRGMFKGEPAASDEMLSAGYAIDKKTNLTSRRPYNKPMIERPDVHALAMILESTYYSFEEEMNYVDIMPSTELTAIFPSGFIGLSEKDRRLFNATVNTVRLYTPSLTGMEPIPIFLARLGLGDETRRCLQNFPYRSQCYRNGFAHYNPGMRMDTTIRFHVNYPVDCTAPNGKRFPFPSGPFRHMGMEPMSILSCAMNESLLQSHDGILRIAPAVADDQNARFTLHAMGGFVVSAEIKEGKPLWVVIQSLSGQTCRVANPWQRCFVYKNSQSTFEVVENTIEIATVSGDTILLISDKALAQTWTCESIDYPPNSRPKTYHAGVPIPNTPTFENEVPEDQRWGRPMLGLPRLF